MPSEQPTLFCDHEDCFEDCTSYTPSDLDRHTAMAHPREFLERKNLDYRTVRPDPTSAHPLTDSLYNQLSSSSRVSLHQSPQHSTPPHTSSDRLIWEPPAEQRTSSRTTFPPLAPKQPHGSPAARRFSTPRAPVHSGGNMRMVREAARDELRATPRGHPNKRLSSQRAAAVREVGKPAVLRDVEAQRAIREVNLSIAGVPRPPRVRARPAKQLARQAFLGARFSNHDVERDRGGNQFAAPTGRNQSMVQYDEAWENQRHSDGENSKISVHM